VLSSVRNGGVIGRGGEHIRLGCRDRSLQSGLDTAQANGARSLRPRGRGVGDGKLYVAKFNADGTGQWIELKFGTAPIDGSYEAYRFASQADVLVNARLASDAVGATRMDRPEWASVDRDRRGLLDAHQQQRREPHAGIDRRRQSAPLQRSADERHRAMGHDGAYTDVTNCMLLAALPGSVGDGASKTVTNTDAAGATRSPRESARHRARSSSGSLSVRCNAKSRVSPRRPTAKPCSSTSSIPARKPPSPISPRRRAAGRAAADRARRPS
jgi:Bacterial protein of unknown function (DUF839)